MYSRVNLEDNDKHKVLQSMVRNKAIKSVLLDRLKKVGLSKISIKIGMGINEINKYFIFELIYYTVVSLKKIYVMKKCVEKLKKLE